TQRGAMGGPPVQPDGMSLSGVRSPSSRPADFPFADILYVNLEWGADHAETIGELAEELNVSRRQVEAAVESLRRSGAPICTGSRGVWLSQDAEELLANYRALRARALRQLANLRGLQRTARSISSLKGGQT